MSLIWRASQGGTLKTEDGYDKHINCDGSREHVLSFSNLGVQCSHKNCVVNQGNSVNVKDWIFIKDEVKEI